MRRVLALALLLGIAPAAYAAETDEPVRSEAVPAAHVADTPTEAPEIVPVLEVRQTNAEHERQNSVAVQPPRNWLWTVAAIVVAGLILAAVL